MLTVLARFSKVVAILAIISGSVVGFGIFQWLQIDKPGPLAETKTVIIPRGSSIGQVARVLSDSGVISNQSLFQIASLVITFSPVSKGDVRQSLQSGEYAFQPHRTLREVLMQLFVGKTVLRKLTIPEGITSSEIVELLKRTTTLDGDLPDEIPANGSLLPETYLYSLGDSRNTILQWMRRAMNETMEKLWTARSVNAPATPAEAVIIASLVERETSEPAERAHVAAVFLNRLKRNMKLQSDSTVIFAISNGSMIMDRPLTQKDLTFLSPYNTYLHTGLPPAPITNPGRASIEATLHPLESDDLYFVTDEGSGNHLFATTLEEHNRNISKIRQLQQSRQKKKSSTP